MTSFDFREHPIEAEQEVRELLGQCLWDVFSNSHEVVGPDGRVLDLGSFRASGGFLAEIQNRQTGAEHYDYLKKMSTAAFRVDGRPCRDVAGKSSSIVSRCGCPRPHKRRENGPDR